MATWLGKKTHKSVRFSQSTKIILNSKARQNIYNSQEFQAHLVLKVVNKDHCIYVWGLQESVSGRSFSVPVNPKDIILFHPLYGRLGWQLMATDIVPILLMSANC